MQKTISLRGKWLPQFLRKCNYFIVITMLLASQVQIFAADRLSTRAPVLQQITVSGTVADDAGATLPGVNISVKGTTIGVVSNIDGKFTITVPNEEAVLVFSFLGYTAQEITVGSNRDLSVTMFEDSQQLDELVVTGYGVQKKATLTGSVSTLSNRELTVTKNENVVNMLAGKMPGLRITQRTSQPGQYNTVIDLRGYGEPLFVVDGVPRDKDYFSRMDPEEIESISLLKDASAAIYGLRAANGVMLITTKSGVAQEGKVDITYSGSLSWQQMLFIPDGYTIVEWMTLRNEQAWQDFNNNYFSTTGARHSDVEIGEAAGMQMYNWQKKVFREFTPQTQHNLSINGGNDKLRYFFSLGYAKQDGCYSSGSLWADKWNFRSNVDAKITQRLSTRVSLGATVGRTHEPNGDMWDVYKAAFLQSPTAPFYANNDPNYLNGSDKYDSEFTNLIGKTNSDYVGYFLRNDRRLNGSLQLTYEIPGISGLSARAFYDYFMSVPDETRYKQTFDTFSYNGETFEKVATQNGPDRTISRRTDVSMGTNMQLGLSYQKKFENHNFEATVVFEDAYSKWENYTAQRILILSSEYLINGETEGQTGSGGRPGDRTQRAFIGKFNYDYGNKYLLSFLFREEANSRWPKKSRWGFFPSVSAGWRISEEGFIKNNLDFVSNIKIRASWGQMGDEGNANDYPDTFTGYETWDQAGWIYSASGPTQGIRATAIPNLDKTWIKVTMQNIALDFGLFKDKITGTFELFQRDRDGLMANRSVEIPGTVGANLPQENLESDRHRGWELELAHHNRISGISYFVSGQISSTRRMWNKKMEEPASNSFDHWRNRYSGRYHNDDMWWARKMEGMFTSIEQIRNFTDYPIGQATLPGDWYQLDWNGDGIVDGGDQYPIASKGLPWFNYGFSLGASYKGFDLMANFQGAAMVFKQLNEVFVEPLPFGGKYSLNWFVDRWHPVDPEADYFHPDTQWVSGYYPITGRSGRRDESNGIMNASYCRLKTVELGYTLPNNWLEKIKIKSLRVYVSGYNLLTFTPLRNIDPERQSSTERAGGSAGGAENMYIYPNNKTYTIGASIKF